jgi:hypothetical protein
MNVERPIIVCLCGSTRFFDAFQKANYEETMAGRIVLSVGFYPHCSERAHGESVGCTVEQKAALDELHKRKIDLADEIYVLNVDRYIGESTMSEIKYAEGRGKPVRYLEPPKNCRACSYCYMDPDSDFICGHPDGGTFGKLARVAAASDGHCGPLRPKFEQHPRRRLNGNLKGLDE